MKIKSLTLSVLLLCSVNALAGPTKVSLATLSAAYNKNTLSADKKFKNKQLIITSAVTEISTDFLGNGVLSFSTGAFDIMPITATLKEESNEKASTLSSGDIVTLECTGAGDMMKIPLLNDCIIK